ncbi:MAG TPA: DUF4230 domain-containing protein [Chitinophagaceae bacterium]|nr:DUF4230 domain-containing protein [Chitinophagaceae bacterium]
MKAFTKYIIIVIAGILFILLLQKTNMLPDVKNIFRSKPVLIANTPVLIKEIRELTQLITVTSFDEVVVDSVKPSTDMINAISRIALNPLAPAKDRIVIVARGSVQAGTNLHYLADTDIIVEDDSVAIHMPQAQILEVIVNPSGFSTFTETGVWSPDAVNLVKAKAKRVMEFRAVQKNILQMAEKRSRLLMENFLLSAGFKKVTFL